MRVHSYIRNNYRAGWKIIDTIKKPTITVNIQRTGWVGDASLESPNEYPLGAEVQLIDADTNQTLWLGVIVERSYRSSEMLYRYKARGICEHFLDLPYPYTQYDQQRQRTGNAQAIWEYHLQQHLRYHTPRYTTLYGLNLSSIPTRDYALRTVRDAYKLYQSVQPCRITPQILTTGQSGRIRMTLEALPLTPYALPRGAAYEVTESILESASRISLNDPAKQLIKDRRVLNPEYWQLVVPTGASATVAVQDDDERGYLGAYATRVDVSVTLSVWVGLRYRDKIKIPKDAQGNNTPIVIGMRVRGDNASLRAVIGGVASTPQYASASYTEIAWQVNVPNNQSEAEVAIEVQPTTQTLPAYAVIDSVYCIPGTASLDERDYPPHQIVTDQIPSYLTAGVITQIQSVVPQGGGVYDIVVNWSAFPVGVSANTPVQILQNSQYLRGVVVQRNSDITLRVQIQDPYAPQEGDILYVMHHPTSDIVARAESAYDTRYANVDIPVALDPQTIANLITQVAAPRATLTAQIPLGHAPLPEIGQTVPHPKTGDPLPIYSIDLPVINGQLHAVQIQAGSPEITMRALFRPLRSARGI